MLQQVDFSPKLVRKSRNSGWLCCISIVYFLVSCTGSAPATTATPVFRGKSGLALMGVSWTIKDRLAIQGQAYQGQDLLYTKYPIFIGDLDKQSLVTLTTVDGSAEGQDAVLSPQGDLIAYADSGRIRILSLDTNAGKTSELLLPDTLYGPMAWSPDGQRLAILIRAFDKVEIYVVDIATLQQTLVLDMPADNPGAGPLLSLFSHDIAWSPDGAKLAFTVYWPSEKPSGEYTSQGDIYLLTFEGGELSRLTDSPSFNDFSPSWSPSGRSVLYVTAPVNNIFAGRLSIITVDGSCKKIIPSPSNIGDAAWSPEGDRIAIAQEGNINFLELSALGEDLSTGDLVCVN
ncbi:MAG: PD40 domain-containing protein [Chloroflexi bacterium]|nr:PD40 domain-containing protein [Chloroflexota bacterium]